MFDIGWTELLLIGIVALIVVGPKDLPMLFRKAGQFMGRARGMAREFSRAMEQAADETGMKDAAKTMRDMANPGKAGMDVLNQATDGLRKWQPDSATAKLAQDRAAAMARAKTVSPAPSSAPTAAPVAAAAAEAGQDPGAVSPPLAVPQIRTPEPPAAGPATEKTKS